MRIEDGYERRNNIIKDGRRKITESNSPKKKKKCNVDAEKAMARGSDRRSKEQEYKKIESGSRKDNSS